MADILVSAFKSTKSKHILDIDYYWTDIKYSGIYIEPVAVLNAAEDIKERIVQSTINSLPSDYLNVDAVFLSLLIRATLYKNGFLLTPLECLDIITNKMYLFRDYSNLATFVSSISIKERITRVLNDKTYEYITNSVVDKVVDKELKYDLNGTLFDTFHILSPEILVHSVGSILYSKYKSKGYDRKLIRDSIQSDMFLFLKNKITLKDIYQADIRLSDNANGISSLPMEQVRLGLSVYRDVVTRYYYEPLIFTRYNEDLPEDSNLHLLNSADIYSKLIRISNIRRRSISQDSIYVTAEGIFCAFSKLYESLLRYA